VKYDLFIVRYGEIGLKAKETRRRFENILINSIKNALRSKQIANKIKSERGRIYVYTVQISKTTLILQKIFGITSFSPAIITKSEIDLMSDLSIKVLQQKLSDKKSFALRITRTGEHNFSSQDAAVKIGNDIVKETKASVNLTNPDFELFIEIRNENAYFFTEKKRGTGGLPLGTQGKVIALIDNPNSILAAWCLMRRGCKTIFVNTQDLNIDNIKLFNSEWYANSEIITLNFKSKNFYEDINKLAVKSNCDSLVSGYTIINDTSKNLSAIKSLKKHIRLPILYPLIAMKEDEINKKCKEIGISI
jgi:thiamine biosynthesis protein ThiI